MLRLGSQLYPLDTPIVMGILNVTPDSFFAGSRVSDQERLLLRAQTMVDDRADILDLGGFSTRPGSSFVTEEEEMDRVANALRVLQSTFSTLPPLSIDTFRSSVAERCIDEFGVAMINDVGGGELDDRMFEIVSRYHTSYVLMHSTPFVAEKSLLQQQIDFFSASLARLRLLGHTDVVIDPGFGFNKSIDENYELLRCMDQLRLLECPLLVGVSRKRMIHQALGVSPEDSLNGTTVIHTLALTQGAKILRVHDVKPAKEAIDLWKHYSESRM